VSAIPDGSVSINGPVALIDGHAALTLAQVLAGSLRDGLSLNAVLADSGLKAEEQAEARAAARALAEAGRRWLVGQQAARSSDSGTAATRRNEGVLLSTPMSTKDAAAIIGLSPRRIQQLAARGAIGASLVGSRYLLDHDAVLAFCAARCAA
jgi:excisionase family DNA binding protein